MHLHCGAPAAFDAAGATPALGVTDMKPFAAAILAAAAYGLSTGVAVSYYDPSESELVPAPAAGNPMTADEVAAATARYTVPVRFWDPAESEFVEVKVAPVGTGSAIATSDPAPVRRGPIWDPAATSD